MVKKGFVDRTAYDTTSILKFITRRFDLEPLPGVRASMGDLTNAIDVDRAELNRAPFGGFGDPRRTPVRRRR